MTSSSGGSRRHKLVDVVRNFRDARFRPLVLRAYSYRCCLTGVALRLVDAAHVVPVSDPTSSDEPRNGVALNPLLHRAYDAGLLGLLPGGKTALNERLVTGLRKQKLDAGLDLVRGLIPREMTKPNSPEFYAKRSGTEMDRAEIKRQLRRQWTRLNAEIKLADEKD